MHIVLEPAGYRSGTRSHKMTQVLPSTLPSGKYNMDFSRNHTCVGEIPFRPYRTVFNLPSVYKRLLPQTWVSCAQAPKAAVSVTVDPDNVELQMAVDADSGT